MSAKQPTIIAPLLSVLVALAHSQSPYGNEADLLRNPTRVGSVISPDECSIGSGGQINRPVLLNLCSPAVLPG